MSYSENLVNKIPYGYSSICPHDLTGGDLVMPLELEADIKQGNLKGLAASLKKVREYRQRIMEEIQRIKLSGGEIWKQSDKAAHQIKLKPGDLVFIKVSRGSTNSARLAIMVSVTTTTAIAESVTNTGQKSRSRFKLSDLIRAVSS